MKAAVFYEPKDIRVEEVPEPTIAEDEVLVEVAAGGAWRDLQLGRHLGSSDLLALLQQE